MQTTAELNPPASREATVPDAMRAKPTAARWTTGAAIVVAFALLLLWLRGSAPVAGGDVGGYVQMLRHFLESGRVDFMRWCQPMFIGVLPVAAPWALAFGTGMGSLSLMGIGYSLLLIVGLYLLVSRYTRPAVAALLTASLAGFWEFLPCAQTFMTDVPYVAYFVWFLLAHDVLVRRPDGTSSTVTSAGLWLLWAGSFLLAALTRPFIFAAIPVFLLQWFMARDGKRGFYRTCALLSTGLAVASFAVTAALGDNRFKPIEQTSLREIFVLHQYARFNIQAMLLSMLSTGLMALPALLVSAEARKRRPSLGDLAAGAAGLVVGLYYWRRGLFSPILSFTQPAAIKALVFAQVIGASVGWVVVYRLMWSTIRGNWGGAAPMLAVVIIAQFASMPIMQHPLLRHAMPAFVALIALVTVQGIRLSRAAVPTAIALILILSASSTLATRRANAIEETTWNVAQGLVNGGAPLDQLDAGWGWFCYYHLHPGQPDEKGYQVRYYDLVNRARYSVGTDKPSPDHIVLRAESITAPIGAPVTITAVDRGIPTAATAASATPKQGATR